MKLLQSFYAFTFCKSRIVPLTALPLFTRLAMLQCSFYFHNKSHTPKLFDFIFFCHKIFSPNECTRPVIVYLSNSDQMFIQQALFIFFISIGCEGGLRCELCCLPQAEKLHMGCCGLRVWKGGYKLSFSGLGKLNGGFLRSNESPLIINRRWAADTLHNI